MRLRVLTLNVQNDEGGRWRTDVIKPYTSGSATSYAASNGSPAASGTVPTSPITFIVVCRDRVPTGTRRISPGHACGKDHCPGVCQAALDMLSGDT